MAFNIHAITKLSMNTRIKSIIYIIISIYIYIDYLLEVRHSINTYSIQYQCQGNLNVFFFITFPDHFWHFNRMPNSTFWRRHIIIIRLIRRVIWLFTHTFSDPFGHWRDQMRGVSRGHWARREPSAVSRNTGGVSTGRQQLGHRSHDAVVHRCSRHVAGGFRVYQAQPHARREGRRQGSVLCTSVRHTAMLSDHVRPRAQTHWLGLCDSEVSFK